jgi:hypothetical protein
LCLEVNDLAVAKLAAGREKDLDFIGGLLRHKLVDVDLIKSRLIQTPLPAQKLETVLARLKRIAQS